MPAAGAESRPPSDGFIKVEVYGRLTMDDAVDVGGINVDVDVLWNTADACAA